jgi:uncharacterized protein (DUF983 family)
MAEVTFGECPVCRQGELFAARQEVTGALIVVCDDCGSQWSSPDQARSYQNVLVQEFSDLRPASPDEVRAAGWLGT